VARACCVGAAPTPCHKCEQQPGGEWIWVFQCATGWLCCNGECVQGDCCDASDCTSCQDCTDHNCVKKSGEECGEDSDCGDCKKCNEDCECECGVTITSLAADVEAACVGSNVTFTVVTDPANECECVTWSGGGEGCQRTYSWGSPGSQTVTATSSCDSNSYASDEVTIVKVDKLQYLDPETGYTDITGTLYVRVGTSVTFKAIPNPSGASWPSNQPVWFGSSGASGTGSTTSVTFNTLSSSTSDYKKVEVACDCADPPTAQVTANVIVTKDVDIEILNIDCSDPANAKVNCRTIGGVASLVVCSAPGTSDYKANVSGDFYFVFNQANVTDTHEISIQTDDDLIIPDATDECTAVREHVVTPTAMETLTAYFITEGVGVRLYSHELYEVYDKYEYSVSYSGEPRRTSHSTSLMDIKKLTDSISSWQEQHKYNFTSWQLMSSGSGMHLPEYAVKAIETVEWAEASGLTGYADCTNLIWDTGNGYVPATPIVNSEVDRSMN